MKTYYRNKILINGLFPMVDFKIDGYYEKKGIFDEKIINYDNPESIFYTSTYMINSSYTPVGEKNVYYEYFENDDLFELDVGDNLKDNKNELQKYYLSVVTKDIMKLEKELRLITGISIGLPVFLTTIYNENKELLTYVGYYNNQSSTFHIWDYNEELKQVLTRRLNFHVNSNSLSDLEKNNSRFERAYTLYNESFSPQNKNVQFALLFSSLESLFNIDSDNITNDISKYSSKIQFLNSKKEKSMIMKIVDYYDIRSKYIHGNIPRLVNDKNLFDLREIVRKVLLIYWFISISYKIYSSSDIISFLDIHDRNNLDLQVQLFVKSLDIIDYSKFYDETKELLSNGILNILN